MIYKALHKIWIPSGMSLKINPAEANERFLLLFKGKIIGELLHAKDFWTFQYSESFKQNPFIEPLLDFPDIHKEYKSKDLWPFFVSRIPTINQPYQLKKIRKSNIEKDDMVGLLKLFGQNTIANPFELKVS